MKKLLSFIVAAIMLAASFSAVFSADDITVMLDGTKLEFDIQPQIINDRTMVPMRGIFEALGADVVWNGDTRTITSTKGDTEIIMMIGYSTMYVDLDTVMLDAAPVIIGDRTLVPLRAVAESFDCKVDWEGDTRTVTIYTDEALLPLPSPSPSSSPSPSPEVSASPSPSASAKPSGSSAASPSDDGEAYQAPDSGTGTAEPSSSPEATETPEETEAPNEAEASGETAQTDDDEKTGSSSAAGQYNIEYDSTNERNASYANNFKIIEITENDEGDYDITYTVQTYREDSGNIALTFNCYDEDGDKIGSFSEIFHTWAYSWTEQEANATIPWGTVRIELELINN